MIHLQQIKVAFKRKNSQEFLAVNEVSLKVKPGDIYGIVGFSGAGKSTLVRTINLLQRPNSGQVIVDGEDLTLLKEKDLRKARRNIGMIFQHFNLMNSRTVNENIAFPLKGSGLKKEEINRRVEELLQLVELQDKGDTYPSQLSGGQKQRVAIARALANHPKILLCDEATSALDPKTTASILKLLKTLNEKLNITMVLITHQMEVVKQICNKVAVMDQGVIIERGELAQVFTSPQQDTTKSFIHAVTHSDEAIETITDYRKMRHGEGNETLIKLSYKGDSAGKPIISELYHRFSVKVNILFGNIEILQGSPYGNLIVLISGEDPISREKALKFLEENQVEVEILDAPPNLQNEERQGGKQ